MNVNQPEEALVSVSDLLQSLQDLGVLLLLLFGLCNGGLVLLSVGHGHHGQDEADEVEGTQEDDDHEEDHVGFTCCSQRLQRQTGGRQTG